MGSASRSRARNRLSALAISKVKEPCALHDGGGLYLQVTRSDDGRIRKSWVLRVRLVSGRIREMGLGSLLDVGLAEARLATEQPIDTSTAAGKAFLDMLGVFAEFETN